MSTTLNDTTEHDRRSTEAIARTERSFTEIVERLSKISVDKGIDAYADIDWDGPGMDMASSEHPVTLPSFDPLGRTDWFRSLPAERQEEIARYRVASMMKAGWHFENLLQRGLLAYAFRLPNGHPAFRYLHHEVIEESQHTLMFQEFVNRSGLPVRGMARGWATLAEVMIEPLAKHAPGMFFVFVMGGEDPIDRVQRRYLEEGIDHPLTERIMRIHVAEEARHLSFARHSFKRRMPKASRPERAIISVVSPVVLGIMARIMLDPPSDLLEFAEVPTDVRREISASADRDHLRRSSLDKTRDLFVDVGLCNPIAKRLWKAMGIWS